VIPDPIDAGDDIIDAVDWNALLGLWLQPLATIIAGTLAVLAAAIAYRAVTRQIKANAENVQKQIDAAAAEQQKNRADEWARMRRREVLDLLVEAGHLTQKLSSIATTFELHVENPQIFSDPEDHRVKETLKAEYAELDLQILINKLKVLGLTAVSDALDQFATEARHIIHQTAHGEWSLFDLEQAVIDAIREALREPPSS
jgi:ribosomal silencing factor RsfS